MLPSFVADDSRRRVAAGMMVGGAFRLPAQMLVKRILRNYGDPSDLQDAAGHTVPRQAEALFSGRGGLIVVSERWPPINDSVPALFDGASAS